MFKPLSQVRRRDVSEVLALRSESQHEGIQAGLALTREAKEFGLGLRQFLDLAVDVRGSAESDKYRSANGYLSGYEASLAALNLPVNDNLPAGHVLDAASDTFQTYPGTRALFPEVVDDVVRWKYRQEQLETTAAFVAQSRTVNGVEMISTVIEDNEEDYQVNRAVAELGRFPVRTIRSGQTAVQFYKHGGGLRISYEFARRVRLDMLTPFNNRAARETERSKVITATHVLLNGDGVNGAAPVVAQSAFDANAAAGKLSWEGMSGWLVARAKAGTPVDTVIGNWDAYLLWLRMFALPTSSLNRTDAENLAATGFQMNAVPLVSGTVNFALSSGVPAGRLLGISKGDTIEELIEAGSNIDESERAIQNQSITYVKSENSGYKLAFGDTRSVYNFGA
ncbi:hypothetical protein [Palleronia sp.]|uniref:phage major capsid protein n=1 Tax=Palleronia sp. TaxID=1940284 RepID=UPI0035C7FED9